jgi:hypothetical protein
VNLELQIFDKSELIRSCELLGYKNKNNSLNDYTVNALKKMILEKANPKNNELRHQYFNALKVFKIKYKKNISNENLKEVLYDFSRKQLDKAIKKLSKRKKKKLTAQLEKSIDPDLLAKLKKSGKMLPAAGGGILLLQAGAITLTGANLGICMLLTTGLSTISGILGITFPFAAYTTIAVVGGYIIQAGHFLASPYTAIPLLGITTYLIYRKIRNKQYINLAGINYLIEVKKRLELK